MDGELDRIRNSASRMKLLGPHAFAAPPVGAGKLIQPSAYGQHSRFNRICSAFQQQGVGVHNCQNMKEK